ncbi:MAG: nucleotide-binding domain containing protein, partial [Cyanobacteria bacterium J06636_27]
NMAEYVITGKPGAIIVGSHVKKTTQQLEVLLQEKGIVGIEVDVAQLLDNGNQSATLLTHILKNVLDV